MFASHHKLDNLIAIVDRNGLCATSFTEDIVHLDPLHEKWKAFGWDVQVIDGHSLDEIMKNLSDVRSRDNKGPLMLIANTVKGKGVSYLIDKAHLHYTAPTAEQRESALKDLGF